MVREELDRQCPCVPFVLDVKAVEQASQISMAFIERPEIPPPSGRPVLARKRLPAGCEPFGSILPLLVRWSAAGG